MGWVGAVVSCAVVAALAVLMTREPFAQHAQHVIDKLYEVVEPVISDMAGKPFSSSSAHAAHRLFTKEELKDYDGRTKSQIYLAVVGNVYDVTKGERFYAAGNHYGGFSGKDGSRAFVTGEFNEAGLTEDISDFTPSQMHEIYDWQEFYATSYTHIGRLIGRYYDKDGAPTEHYRAYEAGVEEARRVKKNEADDRKKFPPCNSEWKQDSGSRVWCTNKSGGIERDWVGVPRKYKKQGQTNVRCACVRTTGPPTDDPSGDPNHGDLNNPHLQLYRDCAPQAQSCPLIKD